MPADSALQPLPTDFETASLQKINRLYFDVAPRGVDPALAPQYSDTEHASLQKINQLVWNGAYGPPLACTYPPGCSGTLRARTIGDPDIAVIQIVGQASSVSQWDGTYSFILAYMPPSLLPSKDQFVLVPSSYTASKPNAISCAWFKPTGEIAMGVIYAVGQDPLKAWFNSVAIQV